MKGRRLLRALAALTAIGLLAGTATVAASTRHTSAGSYKIGVVYSRTGLLAAYGAEYIEGFRLGLQYATKGTMKVNGHKLQITTADDGTDPAKAVSAGKDLIGQGYKILMGSTASPVGLQMGALAAQNHVLFISGPAANDGLTGLNKYTFRSGRQTYQDIMATDSFLGNATGKKILVFAQDSPFGQGNYAVVKAVLGGKGHTVDKILVPLSASDFTPFARQAKQDNPDLLFVAWAGSTTQAMWLALQQQKVFGVSNKVVTGLAERATWPFYAPALGKIQFFTHYVYLAPKNKVNNWLVKQMRKRSQVPDLFTPDGFAGAQMIVHALQKAKSDNPDKLVSALEGYKFLGPKGQMTVRKSDHALLQPMFRVKLNKKGKRYTVKVLGTASASRTAPPPKPIK